MGRLVIESLVFEGMTDRQLDLIRGTINKIFRHQKPGSWLMMTGELATNVIWISPATAIRLDYDGTPSTTADIEFIEVDKLE